MKLVGWLILGAVLVGDVALFVVAAALDRYARRIEDPPEWINGEREPDPPNVVRLPARW